MALCSYLHCSLLPWRTWPSVPLACFSGVCCRQVDLPSQDQPEHLDSGARGRQGCLTIRVGSRAGEAAWLAWPVRPCTSVYHCVSCEVHPILLLPALWTQVPGPEQQPPARGCRARVQPHSFPIAAFQSKDPGPHPCTDPSPSQGRSALSGAGGNGRAPSEAEADCRQDGRSSPPLPDLGGTSRASTSPVGSRPLSAPLQATLLVDAPHGRQEG